MTDNKDTLIDPRLLNLNATKAKTATKRRSLAATYQKFRKSIRSPSSLGSSGHYIEETIILEIGSRYSKVGFVGEPAPRRICKTKLYFGDERKSKKYAKQKFEEGRKVKF